MSISALTQPRRWWGLHPATRCLMAGAEEGIVSRIASLHSKHGANLLKVRNPKFGEQLQNVPMLSPDELLVASKMEHEIDHLQRHLATSYGLVMHLIHSRRADLFFQAIAEHRPGENIAQPMFPDDSTATVVGSETRSKRHQLLHLGYRALEDLFTCDSTAPMRPDDEGRAAAWSALHLDLFDQSGCQSTERIRESFVRDTTQAASEMAPPMVPFEIAGERKLGKFGAYALLEVFDG